MQMNADEAWMLHHYVQQNQPAQVAISGSNSYPLPDWLNDLANKPAAEQVRIVCLAFAGAVWLAAMVVPTDKHIHSSIEDAPYLLIGLVIWAGAQVAHWLGANLRFYWFFGILLMLANWF